MLSQAAFFVNINKPNFSVDDLSKSQIRMAPLAHEVMMVDLESELATGTRPNHISDEKVFVSAGAQVHMVLGVGGADGRYAEHLAPCEHNVPAVGRHGHGG